MFAAPPLVIGQRFLCLRSGEVEEEEVMPAFVREIHIEAPQEKVWEAIADFGEIAKWSPVIKQSWRTGDVAEPIAVGS